MKLMILGASNAQLTAIKKAKQLGHQVVTLDYLSFAIGHSFSDEQCYTSTFDIEGVTKAAQEYDVQGIMTMGTDQPVLSGTIAARLLKLPTWITDDIAYKVTNKIAMKETFMTHAIPTMDYLVYEKGINESELKTLHYPVVVKPVDSQGQRGIYYLETEQEVINYYECVIKYSRQKEILVESYYPHEEVTVSGWVIDGMCIILTVTDRVTFNSTKQLGVCLAHTFPSKFNGEYSDKINRLTRDIVAAFEIKNGPIYFQYLIGEQGIKVNEIACRIGGAYEAEFIPRITEFDIVEAQIAIALGQSYDASSLINYNYMKNPYHVSVQLFFVDPITIAALTDESVLKSISGVIDFGYNVCVGQTVSTIENATQRAGYAVIIGLTQSAIEQSLNALYSHLQILDHQGENHVIYTTL